MFTINRLIIINISLLAGFVKGPDVDNAKNKEPFDGE